MMRGARAEIHHRVTKLIKGQEPEVREKTMAVKVPNAMELVGDGNANVSRTKTFKLSLPYGEASMSASCTVALTCNQDDKTISRTAKLCTRIIDKLMESDQLEIAKFIEDMRNEAD